MYYNPKKPLAHLPFSSNEERRKYESEKLGKFLFGDSQYRLEILKRIREDILKIYEAALDIWDLYPVHNSLIATIREYALDELRLVEARINEMNEQGRNRDD